MSLQENPTPTCNGMGVTLPEDLFWLDLDKDYVDPDDDTRTHPESCSCEDCFQNYPERFDEDGENIFNYRATDEYHRTKDEA